MCLLLEDASQLTKRISILFLKFFAEQENVIEINKHACLLRLIKLLITISFSLILRIKFMIGNSREMFKINVRSFILFIKRDLNILEYLPDRQLLSIPAFHHSLFHLFGNYLLLSFSSQ